MSDDYVTPRRRAELKSYVRPGRHSVWSDDEVAKLIRQIEDQETELQDQKAAACKFAYEAGRRYGELLERVPAKKAR